MADAAAQNTAFPAKSPATTAPLATNINRARQATRDVKVNWGRRRTDVGSFPISGRALIVVTNRFDQDTRPFQSILDGLWGDANAGRNGSVWPSEGIQDKNGLKVAGQVFKRSIDVEPISSNTLRIRKLIRPVEDEVRVCRYLRSSSRINVS